jgi:hypothetical protein
VMLVYGADHGEGDPDGPASARSSGPRSDFRRRSQTRA